MASSRRYNLRLIPGRAYHENAPLESGSQVSSAASNSSKYAKSDNDRPSASAEAVFTPFAPTLFEPAKSEEHHIPVPSQADSETLPTDTRLLYQAPKKWTLNHLRITGVQQEHDVPLDRIVDARYIPSDNDPDFKRIANQFLDKIAEESYLYLERKDVRVNQNRFFNFFLALQGYKIGIRRSYDTNITLLRDIFWEIVMKELGRLPLSIAALKRGEGVRVDGSILRMSKVTDEMGVPLGVVLIKREPGDLGMARYEIPQLLLQANMVFNYDQNFENYEAFLVSVEDYTYTIIRAIISPEYLVSLRAGRPVAGGFQALRSRSFDVTCWDTRKEFLRAIMALGSRSPATKSPLSQQLRAPSEPGLSRSAKKRAKNAAGREDGGFKTEPKAVADDVMGFALPTEQQDLSNQPQLVGRPPSNRIVSPVLDALSSFGNQDNDIAHRTDSWAQSIPFGRSPPHDLMDGLSISDSPPNIAALGETGGFSHSPSPASPPSKPRPLSYANGQSNFTPSRYPSGDRQKRHSSSNYNMNHVPLPHLPQPHFYSAPDIDIPNFPSPNMRPVPETGYTLCAFDTIPNPHSKSSRFGGKVLLVGRDGGLEVLNLEGDKARVVGKLEGLNGRVLDAKVLTWASRADPFASSRPLVAISIHGPALQPDDTGAPSSADSDHVEIVPAVSTRRSKREELRQDQTRVLVYSLKTQEHITTLFSTKSLPCLDNYPGLPASASAPVANFKIHASGNFVVLASGISGEVFIYTAVPHSSPGAFQCLGKTWTSMQTKDIRRYSSSSNSTTDLDDLQSDGSRASNADIPILSLSGRWLAIVAPSASSHRVSLHGTISPQLIRKKTYGIDSHMPPSRPSVTCGVDSGEGESLLNKVARGVTQELFKGARWIGDQGMQTWNNYWNKDAQLMQPAPTRRFEPQLWHGIFPPTHAPDTQAGLSDEPELVSIIDLKKLEESHDTKSSFPAPIATFQPPDGCSFLSFAPNGLMLLTTSKKGDIQFVWDLMQIKHCRARAFISDDPASSTDPTNPPALHVRQVARYARLTTSSVVDVIWTVPTGENMAIITKKGTVHVYDLPRAAFQWPPLRRPVASKKPKAVPAGEELEEISNTNPFAAAMKFVGGTTQPILAAVRNRAPSVGTFTGSAGGLAATGVRGGGKVVAAGLSKSVGAATGTVNTLRHVGENRLHLSGFSRDAAPSRVTWYSSDEEAVLAVIDSGRFKAYRVRRSLSNAKNKQGQSVIGVKILDIRLPPNVQIPNMSEPQLPVGEPHITGFWSLPSPTLTRRASGKLKSQPLSQAEIETNAPYQPFHTDRRVNLMVYPSGYDEKENMRSQTWAFGGNIPFTKLNLRPATHSDDDDNDNSAGQNIGPGEIENLISLGNGGDAIEHVVITSRRKKRVTSSNSPGGIATDEDGFFEDDCDVLDFARDRV
ncbi:hypothetical protein FQN50_005376 [Emmonsiellopsis sp. PD_5]|nr:hypothetical protein FQN50_005376 [Emmonsiellopsis sp. PD_5]